MNDFHAWLWSQQRKGKSLDELSELTGLSRDKIHRCITAHRWERGEVVMSAKQLTQAYVVEGKSIHQIAECLLCSYEAVRVHLVKYGIPRRHKGGNTINPQNNGKGEYVHITENKEELFSNAND